MQVFLKNLPLFEFQLQKWKFYNQFNKISIWNKGSQEAVYTECTQRLRFTSPNLRNTAEASKSGFCFSWRTCTVSGVGQTALGSCAAQMFGISSAARYLWRWPGRDLGQIMVPQLTSYDWWHKSSQNPAKYRIENSNQNKMVQSSSYLHVWGKFGKLIDSGLITIYIF